MMSLIPAEHRKHADVRFFFFADHRLKSLIMQINSLSFDLNVDSLLKKKKKEKRITVQEKNDNASTVFTSFFSYIKRQE